jgi:alkanesulfonate monooxygenase SsuD/methylene tetrahydromethanopterin reductase-like flavin-dependent oxidoreductase (luciferase family)
VIFVVYPNIEIAKRDYAAFKAAVASCGRRPEHVKITQLVNTVSAATRAEAEDKWVEISKLPIEIDALSLLSEALNFDFGPKGMDEAFADEEMAQISGLQGIRDTVVRMSGRKNPTVRDFIHFSGRGRVHNPIVGGPKEVADRLEQWFTQPACDGFVISATHVPGTYEDFARFVIPELQRRGLFRADFAGNTLRENLGFPVPQPGDWRRAGLPTR